MTIRTPSTTGYSKLVDKTTGAPLATSKQSSTTTPKSTSAIATKSSATVAVCMAGAARTVVHPVVIHTHRHHLLKPLKADLFAAVSLAKDTAHSTLSKNPESELRLRGTERWRVQEALQLLGAIEVRYVEDEDAKPPMEACVGSKGASTWPHMFWSVELCGEVLRAHEDARGQPYEWVVRTRPDTFFRSPINPLPRTAPHPASFYCGRNNDAFFVAAPLAAQGLLSIYGQIAFQPGCRLVGNTSFARTLPWRVQCGLRGLARERRLARGKGFIYADCLMNLAIHVHRLRNVGCAAELGTIGRDFFRAYYCDMTNRTESCVTSGWSTRAPAIYFPVPAHEQPSDHGNMTLDHDIYKWGIATGAIIRTAPASPSVSSSVDPFVHNIGWVRRPLAFASSHRGTGLPTLTCLAMLTRGMRDWCVRTHRRCASRCASAWRCSCASSHGRRVIRTAEFFFKQLSRVMAYLGTLPRSAGVIIVWG